MADQNMILYLPFDEQKGSSIAYDYSDNRADGLVTNAGFVPGKVGNAIEFNGQGHVDVSKEIFTDETLNGSWTIMAWIKGGTIDAGTPSKIVVTIPFDEVNKYIVKEIEVAPETWKHIAVVKAGAVFKFYIDTNLIGTEEMEGTITGFSIDQPYFGSDNGLAQVDDFKIFDIVLAADREFEIPGTTEPGVNHAKPNKAPTLTNQISNVRMLEYYIDGVNLRDLGIVVSKSSGLTDRPKMKAPTKESWADYHGSMVDLNHKYLEDRVITLNCFMKTTGGKSEFVAAVNDFLSIFDKRGTHRLMVDIHPTKPLVYEVYLNEAIEITKTWNDDLMIGTFTLKLVEPSPVKRVLRAAGSVTIKVKTNKMFDVYWGDGTAETDVFGDEITLSHSYTGSDYKYIIVAGCVDEFESFETNAIVVWQKI